MGVSLLLIYACPVEQFLCNSWLPEPKVKLPWAIGQPKCCSWFRVYDQCTLPVLLKALLKWYSSGKYKCLPTEPHLKCPLPISFWLVPSPYPLRSIIHIHTSSLPLLRKVHIHKSTAYSLMTSAVPLSPRSTSTPVHFLFLITARCPPQVHIHKFTFYPHDWCPPPLPQIHIHMSTSYSL